MSLEGDVCGAFFTYRVFQTLTKAGVILYNKIVEPTAKKYERRNVV